MKKYKYLLIVLLFTGLSSCSDFLNVTPKNVISMDELESVKKAMAGFLYNIREDGNGTNSIPRSPFEYPVVGLVEYTDEWDLSKFEAKMTDYRVQIADWRNEGTQHLWCKFYNVIGFMNLIIYEGGRASGQEDMRDYVTGEAYAMRAYCFFKLVQHFSPYKNNELGIPLCLESYEDFEKVNLERATQKETYAQILSDLKEAEKRLERTASRETYNLMYNSSVINRLYADIYHFKALSASAEATDWTNAALYADKETKGNELESDPAVLKQIFDVANRKVNNDKECALRAYCGGGGYNFYGLFSDLELNQKFYSENFPNDNDIRKALYYREVTYYDYNIWDYVTELRIDKFNSANNSFGYLHLGFRLTETLLIQAEALAMSGQLPQAKEVLRRFKEARYTADITIPDDKDAFLQDVYRERRKEFVAEGDICWLDMKRLGLTAERTLAGTTYKLNGEGDYRYTFPIPTFELDNNKYIRQNPGWKLND